MDMATKKAVQENRLAIMSLIESLGPRDYNTIKWECELQANGEPFVKMALDELVAQGALTSEPNLEDSSQTIYDTPCQPWPDAA